ncbi:MAG: type II secretion system protein [Kosmotoga sp.]|uniref:type II secretion system protein n=1 Tax=Kosmotoga sp. TaxID=1955248 RepID=UPI0025BDDA06|nr:type II secretion system protein [Kosmotoga sp.]MCD6160152.1 type II secretion system protein [Kosmotoga sp.]
MKRGFSLVETIIALLVVGIFLISSMFVISHTKEISNENQHAVRFLAAKSAIIDFFMYSPSATTTMEAINDLLDRLGLSEFELIEDVDMVHPGNDENISLYTAKLRDTLTRRSDLFYVVGYNEP